MDLFDVFSKCSAQRRLNVQRKRMVAGRTALDEALSDQVWWQTKPSHDDSIKMTSVVKRSGATHDMISEPPQGYF